MWKQGTGADENIAANDGLSLKQLRTLSPSRSGIVAEATVDALIASSASVTNSSSGNCSTSNATTTTTTSLAPRGVLTNLLPAKRVDPNYVGADQCFTIDGAFSDAFLEQVDRLRQSLPMAKVSVVFCCRLVFCLLQCRVGR